MPELNFNEDLTKLIFDMSGNYPVVAVPTAGEIHQIKRELGALRELSVQSLTAAQVTKCKARLVELNHLLNSYASYHFADKH